MLTYDIKSLSGVGKKRAELLEKLGIKTVSDILAYYPYAYEDRTKVTHINEVLYDEVNIIKARAVTSGENVFFKNKCLTKFTFEDETGTITACWFNRPYLKNSIKKHDEYVLIGKVILSKGAKQIYPTDYQTAADADSMGIIPKYRLTAGVTPKLFRKIIFNTIKEFEPEETLPQEIIKKERLADKAFAVNNIHFPENREAFFKARERLVFEELFVMCFTLAHIKKCTKNEKNGIVFKNNNLNDFISKLPFTLTNGQTTALADIVSDLSGGYMMNRLLQGDVGCGKTIIAAAACYLCVKNGYQAAVMAPTEILANQHYAFFVTLFADVALLTGKLDAAQRAETVKKIKTGIYKIVIGTHSLIYEHAQFKNLALCVTDEQHRFGVRQRQVFNKKSAEEATHILAMSATPIPRSLALVLYGDMDISLIAELPPGRQKIHTYAVNGSYRKRILEFIKNEIKKGNGVYFVCPKIEENDKTEVTSVKAYEKEISKHLPDIKTALLHGKLKQDEKERVMEEFKAGRVNAVIATTVIEVGIDVPSATVMVIENAERFGLSQLHQLRGRVGRGTEKSYCILISDSKSETAKQRLKALARTNDGFELARLDLELRGSGDFFGTKQHGLPEVKIANLYTDESVLERARAAAKALTDKEKQEIIEKFKLNNKILPETFVL